MKTIQWLILTTAMSVPSVSSGIMIMDTEKTETNSVQTQFALSGTITRYRASKSMIEINRIRYLLASKGGLTDADLKPGKKVRFNLEKMPKAKMGSITRIWIEEKKKK